MIEERYCSYEVSKLLKEKGFDEEVRTYYQFDNETKETELIHDDRLDTPNLWSGDYVSAPTHQMAIDWLRKEHYIYADPIKQGNYNDCSEYYSWIVARMGIIHRNSSVADKLSYEDAVEAALKYALENLI